MGLFRNLFGSKAASTGDPSAPPPLPPLPESGSPDYEDQIFKRFPDAGQFNHMRVSSAQFGAVDVLLLLEGASQATARARVVACLPRPLNFRLDIAPAGNSTEGDHRLAGLGRVVAGNASSAAALLESGAVRDAILGLFRAAGGLPRITHYEASLRLPNCTDITSPPVAAAVALTSAVVLKLCDRAAECGLLQ